MKHNRDRQNHFTAFSSPTPDEDGYQAWMDFQKKIAENNPKFKKKITENFNKAVIIAYTQSKNGIDLLQDNELRYFHSEFNHRVWEHGFGSMPSSFNVLEGFYKWNKELFYFELFEEEEHLFSFFDFIDFITSSNCSGTLDYFIENTQDELIHSYNILNEVKEISFKTSDSKEYVIGGVSFIKRGNEVFMLMVGGELIDTKEMSKNLPTIESDGITKTYLKPSEKRKREAVTLFGKEDIWKVNIYIRIDLESKTIDSRYIQKDSGNSFITFTDDIGMLGQSIKDKVILSEIIKKQIEEIENYAAIFELAYKCLFLPEYFDYNEANIISEEHPTGLVNEKLRNPIHKNKSKYNFNYFYKTKDVWVIDKDYTPKTGNFTLKQSELKIQKDGYWQRLEPGKAGKDKNGAIIHNRTWIEETISWYETNNSINQVQIKTPNKISQHSGFIYLLRNPAHELDLFKIGLTTKTVEERAKQLSGTGSPDKFVIINRWFVSDCLLAEKIIHDKLDKYRLNASREFFKIELELAISVISPIIKELNTTTN